MDTPSEKISENGNQRRRSIGSGVGLNLAGGKPRRYSIGVTSSRTSIGEEGNTVPNYLRASTGSCHDFCKFGKKHEHSKSALPVKFKRTTIVNKEKVPKTVVPVEIKNATLKPSTKLTIQKPAEPVKVTKKDALLSSKKPQVYKQSSLTNGKTKSSPVVANGEGSNGEIKKNDIKTVIKLLTAPKPGVFKKVVAKVNPNGSQSPEASISRAASLKVIKPRAVKHVAPLKDQNRMQKTEPKQTSDVMVQAKSLNDVEAESEVKPETMEFDFMQSSMDLVNPPVGSSSDSFSDKYVAEESPIIHPVCESSERFSDKVLEETLGKEILENQCESSESVYEDEVLENESDYADDEEAEVSEEGFETANVNEMETSVGNHKIPRKGKMVISEDNVDEAVKLRFRRGKILDLQSENNRPRRLKFRRRVIECTEDGQNMSRKTYKSKTLDLQNEDKQRASRRSFEKKYVEETNDLKNGAESVVLKHQGEQEKKDAQGLLNNVIEETASKLVESRKSKVKALVGAFETVISLQDGKPSSG